MRRRNFIAALAGTVAATRLAARAEKLSKLQRIGFLGNSTSTLEANLVGAFRKGLRDLGYVEGQNVLIEYRWAEGSYERFPSLITELVDLKVDVIVTAGTPAALAVQRIAPSIPLVMVAVGDPVGTGLVASLARPGGNITGLTSIAAELDGKRLQLLKEVLPTVSRVAVLWNPDNAYQIDDEKQVRAAAEMLRISVLSMGVRTSKELDNAFVVILRERADALLVLADRLFLHNRGRIADFVIANRLPGMNAYRELVDAGGLMSFGPNYEVMHRQAAAYVDKILKGAKPADLPVEQPEKFDLVISLKTAKALGITIPQSLLLRADEVIQ